MEPRICEICGKTLHNENDWSNHAQLHIRNTMKKELWKKEHPDKPYPYPEQL